MTAALEIRESADGQNWTVEGLGTTYDQPYDVEDRLGRYKETISRGAFAAALGGREVVSLRVQHDRRPAPLATTRSGTLSLFDRAEGLSFRATLPKDDPEAAAAVSKVNRKILDSLSIGFAVGHDGDHWSGDGSRRTIREAHLDEISLVHNPANPAAIVTSLRAEEIEAGYTLRVTSGGTSIVERSGYAAHQLAALGTVGQAIANKNDGGWGFPTRTADDLRESIAAAIAAGAGKDVKSYLARRAMQLGLSRLIPADWSTPGKRSAATPSSVDVDARIFLATGRMPGWVKSGRPPLPVAAPSAPRSSEQPHRTTSAPVRSSKRLTWRERQAETDELRRRAGIPR